MKVVFPTGKLKRLARQMLRGRYFIALVVIFIAYVISRAPSFILSYLSNHWVVGYILDIYDAFISGPVTLGVAFFYLECFRNADDVGLSSFTKGFSNIWSAIVLFCVVLLKTLLWSLLLVVPGIIAMIRYSQAFYILADDPTLRPIECIERSKQIMQFNKGRFFMMELSFLPWYIILSLPAYFYMAQTIDISMAITLEQYVEIVAQAASQPVYVLLSLLPMLVRPYVAVSEACFYDIASGNLQLQFDGHIPYDRDGSSRDVYEITGFETNENTDDEA